MVAQIIQLVCILAFVTLAMGDVVNFQQCRNQTTSCAIHEVRIDPCPEASSDLPCKVKRGKSATISFDYTPSFDSATAFGQVYWASPDGDIPFAGMNTNGCDHTSCPLNKDAKQTYVYTLETAKKFPVRVFDIKWKLSNPITQELCCFQTKIRLIK